MRLKILDNGHQPWQKPILKLIGWMMGSVPGPIAALSYRRNLFGKHFTNCLEEGMRKSTCWSKGEVELFAAFTAKTNSCDF